MKGYWLLKKAIEKKKARPDLHQNCCEQIQKNNRNLQQPDIWRCYGLLNLSLVCRTPWPVTCRGNLNFESKKDLKTEFNSAYHVAWFQQAHWRKDDNEDLGAKKAVNSSWQPGVGRQLRVAAKSLSGKESASTAWKYIYRPITYCNWHSSWHPFILSQWGEEIMSFQVCWMRTPQQMVACFSVFHNIRGAERVLSILHNSTACLRSKNVCGWQPTATIVISCDFSSQMFLSCVTSSHFHYLNF